MLDEMGLDMSGSRSTFSELFKQAHVEEHDIAAGTIFLINQCAVQWASAVNRHIDSTLVTEFASRMDLTREFSGPGDVESDVTDGV